MISVTEARERVLAAFDVMSVIDVPVDDALGYVLANDLHAMHPLPRFDNSAMDGYAVRAEDLRGASTDVPVELELAGEVRAGDPGEIKVLPGTAVRIMTGAPLPPGADAVVPVEESEESDGKVRLSVEPSPMQHIRPAGEDLDVGDTLVLGGTELHAGELALLASMGFSPVSVFARPKVAIVVTGDELVAPEAEPQPGQIRDSNSVALHSLIREAGGEPIRLPRVSDTRENTLEAFRRAADIADIVVSSGGVAVGRYDFVKDVIEELGRIDLWRVAMQPGKPVVLGAIGATPFLGLPGNPVSIHVSFEQFVRPAIRKLRGCRELLRPVIKAALASDLDKRPGRLHFVRVKLRQEGDGWVALPTGPQGSHIQSSLVECHGVARFPLDASHLAAGDDVEVEVWSLPGG